MAVVRVKVVGGWRGGYRPRLWPADSSLLTVSLVLTPAHAQWIPPGGPSFDPEAPHGTELSVGVARFEEMI